MLNGLDLFSGIGGLTIALKEWVRPVAYCEIDRYATGVLLSRMGEGILPVAPIWDDVQTLSGTNFRGGIDIIYGGFPCQDISCAGAGKGLAGKRSGLFFEIVRLAEEIQPMFIFLENVPAIRKRGLHTIGCELASAGYDSRWCVISAAEVGAPHLRKRWFLLAHANSDAIRKQYRGSSRQNREEKTLIGADGKEKYLADTNSSRQQERCVQRSKEKSKKQKRKTVSRHGKVAYSDKQGLEGWECGSMQECACKLSSGEGSTQMADTESAKCNGKWAEPSEESRRLTDQGWWDFEPDVGRVANGIPSRVDRIKCLGNAVVPEQAKEAFKELMGFNLIAIKKGNTMVKKKTKTKKASAKDIKQDKTFKLYKHPKFGMVFGEAVKLPPTRIAWPYLVEPKEGGQNEEGQVFNDRYELVAIYPKKDKEFKKACEKISRMTEAMIELFNKGKRTKSKGFEIGIDGDEFDAEKYPYYQGATVLTMRNANQPLILGTKLGLDGKPKKIDPDLILGGCVCAFVVTPLFTANGGLSFKMNIVQLVEDDGTRFGGSINPNVYADLLDYDGVEETEEEEEEEEDDEVEAAEGPEDEDEDEEDEEEEEDEEDDEEEEEEDDDEEDEEDDEEDEQPKRRGRPAKRKKAVDVL